MVAATETTAETAAACEAAAPAVGAVTTFKTGRSENLERRPYNQKVKSRNLFKKIILRRALVFVH